MAAVPARWKLQVWPSSMWCSAYQIGRFVR